MVEEKTRGSTALRTVTELALRGGGGHRLVVEEKTRGSTALRTVTELALRGGGGHRLVVEEKTRDSTAVKALVVAVVVRGERRSLLCWKRPRAPLVVLEEREGSSAARAPSGTIGGCGGARRASRARLQQSSPAPVGAVIGAGSPGLVGVFVVARGGRSRALTVAVEPTE